MPTLMELTLSQTYASQAVVNRFTYVAEGLPSAVSYSFALTSAFGAIYDTVAVPPGYPLGTIIDALRQIQVSGVTYQSVETKAVYSTTDFYGTGFSPALFGARESPGLSPAVAYGFRTSRVRSDIRRATKRFVGFDQAFNGGGGAISGTAIGLMEQLADKLGEVLQYDDEGNTLTFTPCVVKKQRYIPDPARPDRPAYRYIPEADGGQAAQLLNIATGFLWEVYQTQRTQGSRQIGRGA